MNRLWCKLRRQGIFAQAVALLVCEGLLFAAAAPLALYLHSTAGIIAAGLAAGVCLISALLALWIHHLLSAPESVLLSTLLGMAVNLGLPLAFGFVIHLHGGPISAAGFLYYLLFFYLLTLATKTMLSLPIPRQSHG